MGCRTDTPFLQHISRRPLRARVADRWFVDVDVVSAGRAAGSATIPQRTLTADRLAEAIRTATGDRQLREITQQLAGRIAGEDGATRVVSTVESLLHQPI
jgi:UDP:flavonoid glycosyltransferase YjiC (YdhE family)